MTRSIPQPRRVGVGRNGLFDQRYVVDNFSLILKALFLLAAYLVGERVSTGGLWGGIGGAAIGQAVGAWRARRCAAQRSIQAGPLHRSA